MERYRQTIKNRSRALGGYSFLVVLLIWVGFRQLGAGSENLHVREFIAGYNLGFCIGLELVVIFWIVRYTRALRDDKLLKKFYIKEKDERLIWIRERSGGISITITLAGLALGTIMAGYFNEVVFFTLLGAFFFVALVGASLKLYYRNKY